MPEFVVERVTDALNTVRKSLNGSRVDVLSVSYKPNVGNVRESPALDIIDLLNKHGALVSYTDPYVPHLQTGNGTFESIAEIEVAGIDCAVICTNHSAFQYDAMPGRYPLILDPRNALRGKTHPSIFRL